MPISFALEKSTALKTNRKNMMSGLLVALFTWQAACNQAQADKIKNPTAVFSGLDKITGRIISFEVAVEETVQFGALQLTPRICYSRPATETPNTTSFIEVDEVTLDNKYRRIFGGWVFASSPGLHGIEHPIYDIWLVDCKGGSEIVPDLKEISPEAEIQPKPKRQQVKKASNPAAVNPTTGRVEVAPLSGNPVQPQQSPSRRFFPTNDVP